jgi:hypothetical protein
MQLSFGSGAVWGERTDVTGTGVGPRQFGVLQDVQIDFNWTDKPLYGQFQFPMAVARGQGKITGTAKFAQILGLLYSDIFFGLTPATGQFAVSQLEAAGVPAVTPYTVTVANAANYNDDLGVVYAASGRRFNRVTTPSAVGQYSVNFSTGIYTFSSADASAAVMISYTYSVANSGNKLTLTNQFMGTTPTFKATFYTTYGGSGTALRLNAVWQTSCRYPPRSMTGRFTSSIFRPLPMPQGLSGI